MGKRFAPLSFDPALHALNILIIRIQGFQKAVCFKTIPRLQIDQYDPPADELIQPTARAVDQNRNAYRCDQLHRCHPARQAVNQDFGKHHQNQRRDDRRRDVKQGDENILFAPTPHLFKHINRILPGRVFFCLRFLLHSVFPLYLHHSMRCPPIKKSCTNGFAPCTNGIFPIF